MKLLTIVWDYFRKEFGLFIIFLGVLILIVGINFSINSNDLSWILYAGAVIALMMAFLIHFKQQHEWQCPKCGYKEEFSRTRFCPKCRTKMRWVKKPPPLKCSNGHNISPNDKYRPKCGVKIE